MYVWSIVIIDASSIKHNITTTKCEERREELGCLYIKFDWFWHQPTAHKTKMFVQGMIQNMHKNTHI